MTTELTTLAANNIQDILKYSIKLEANSKVLVIYDTDYELTDILSDAYKIALGELGANANFYNFNEISTSGNDKVIALFDELSAGDLVVLIQSGSFRLNEFRIRLHLFSKKLKVIEHLHLHRNDPETFEVYINSLKYDESEKSWYYKMSESLMENLSNCTSLSFKYRDSELLVGAVEIPKLNIGNYEGMENIGGTYPIGEVFTEAKDFETMNGSIYIYGFADREFNIKFFDPFMINIEKGLIVGYAENTPQDFIDVLDLVKSMERPLIREIGFGLNRAITKESPLGDITAYERILGIHMSLGEKHSVYKKPGITINKTKFHIDLFLCIESIDACVNDRNVQIMDRNGYVV